jgi:hypothetical protein
VPQHTSHKLFLTPAHENDTDWGIGSEEQVIALGWQRPNSGISCLFRSEARVLSYLYLIIKELTFPWFGPLVSAKKFRQRFFLDRFALPPNRM